MGGIPSAATACSSSTRSSELRAAWQRALQFLHRVQRILERLGPHEEFTITERVQAQFRFDAYISSTTRSCFNSNQGNTCLGCGGSAGKITDIQADASPGSPNGMRQLQFGVRVVF